MVDKLALGLSCGLTVPVAAQAAGIGVRTAQRLVNDPEFTAKLIGLRAQIIDRATGILAGHAGKAALTLGALLEKSDEDPAAAGVRLRAAQAILNSTMALRVHLDKTPGPGEAPQSVEECYAVIADEAESKMSPEERNRRLAWQRDRVKAELARLEAKIHGTV